MADDHWYEDETGPMVRPYAVTRGRTRPSGGPAIELMSQVTALWPDDCGPALDHARASLLDLVRRGPRPVVELAADADLPLTVLRVLLGDLTEAGLVRVDEARPGLSDPATDPELLREIVERLREL
ncbi:DUF742 domain-containing protein [Streptomyces sp. NPDC001315]|uniref:DUF742 domain-containing protein n=1 Tax=Streptomyces sp. NPDC001315 TaxID=3364562 RepID=UPI0036AD3599